MWIRHRIFSAGCLLRQLPSVDSAPEIMRCGRRPEGSMGCWWRVKLDADEDGILETGDTVSIVFSFRLGSQREVL